MRQVVGRCKRPTALYEWKDHSAQQSRDCTTQRLYRILRPFARAEMGFRCALQRFYRGGVEL